MATDTTTLKGKIAVMQAAEAGKPLQIRRRFEEKDEWSENEVGLTGWDWVHWDYRIRPEPREFGVWVDQGTGTPRWQAWHEGLRGVAIRVREVLP